MYKTRAFRLIWIFIEKVGLIALSILSFWIIARYLTPSEIGTAVIILSVSELIALFYTTILTSPMLKFRVITPEENGSYFWGSLMLGSASFMLVCGIGALVLNDTAAYFMLAVGALSIPISLLGKLYICHMQRDGAYKQLAVRSLLSKVMGMSSGILLAIYGFGGWAVIGQAVVMQLVSTVVIMFSYKLRVPFCFDGHFFYTKLIKTGWPIALKALNWTAMNKGVEMILAAVSGSAAVGYFNVAKRVVDLPVNAITQGLNSYAIPVMSRRRDADTQLESFRTFFLSATKFSSFVVFPFFLLIAVAAEPIVLTLLGERWAESAPILTVLAIAAALATSATFIPAMLIALDKSQLTVNAIFVTSIIVLIIVWLLGAEIGAMGAAVAIFTRTLLLLPYNLAVAGMLLQIPKKMYLSTFAHAFVGSGVVLLCYATWQFTTGAFMQTLVDVLLIGTLMGVAYLGINFALNRNLLAEFKTFFKS
tara:strand:+ start:10042 stop:11475 length:1434 start_codon:yes stop_codon:yes gene_type:complete